MRYLSQTLVARILGAVLVVTACSPEDAPEPKQQTEILWDTWGVPHVFADDNVGASSKSRSSTPTTTKSSSAHSVGRK